MRQRLVLLSCPSVQEYPLSVSLRERSGRALRG
jgi:hypothetical protein